jgi:hypothetical protein
VSWALQSVWSQRASQPWARTNSRIFERWIRERPLIVGEELKGVTNQFAKFEGAKHRTDVLALDHRGRLVVIEVKPDTSGAYQSKKDDDVAKRYRVLKAWGEVSGAGRRLGLSFRPTRPAYARCSSTRGLGAGPGPLKRRRGPAGPRRDQRGRAGGGSGYASRAGRRTLTPQGRHRPHCPA